MCGAALSALGQQSGIGPSKPPPSTAPDPASADEVAIRLLADPLAGREEFRYLYRRRAWLASRGARLEDFDTLGEEFASRGAFFSAIELLWFAEKMASDPARRERYAAKTRGWLALAEPAYQTVEQGRQLFAAGRHREAVEIFTEAVTRYPYSEKAHYELANAHYLILVGEETEPGTAIPGPLREKIFRLCYEELAFAIAIDPILYDAYYLLSNLRELIPENGAFLNRTQSLTNRALRFRVAVIPPMEKIESGAREPALFEALGRGFEDVGLFDYAFFSYRAALALGSEDPEVPKRIRDLTDQYFSRP